MWTESTPEQGFDAATGGPLGCPALGGGGEGGGGDGGVKC
jgi:hypothetical protein